MVQWTRAAAIPLRENSNAAWRCNGSMSAAQALQLLLEHLSLLLVMLISVYMQSQPLLKTCKLDLSTLS